VTELRERIREAAAPYPNGRSGVMPGLRVAQEHYGWLPPVALEEVADALGYTPAYCLAVASFYDMFHLRPIGRHLIEVCTNLSCALVGAQAVVDAFEAELGVPPGETTDDGEVTFRVVECLGACGYAPAVSLDHRYRHEVRPDEVGAIVEEIRAGS
jgi:NADH-quinone oxidoreductase subunit E